MFRPSGFILLALESWFLCFINKNEFIIYNFLKQLFLKTFVRSVRAEANEITFFLILFVLYKF